MPLYEHIADCHVTVPYGIVYVNRLMYQQYSYMKLT